MFYLREIYVEGTDRDIMLDGRALNHNISNSRHFKR